ncbi:MAG: ribonuclease III [SAR86 cluster bacterium]|uniref:Ribonuclease 3 n=1 Tax=SAR86 cluster bacterium TaxID=2030880 RepID=A0A2A5B0E2_9GAMM|nr:MAG: ribonuclease III [SAR86 cluster bacterium]
MALQLDKLQRKLGYQFSNSELAQQALTHRSANKLNNERLEFLGDSLLGFIIAEALYEIHPEASEGELSRMRAKMVNKSSLASIARSLQLGDFVQLGSGEIKSGGMHRDSILADTVEAVIAAIYLDGGLPPCRKLVRQWSDKSLQAQGSSQKQKDSKTRLQELMQARGSALPEYEINEVSGPAHQQVFHVKCKIELLNQAELGSGDNKRDAEQEAARKILDVLGESN